jgi:hypothetical protein
MKLDSARWLATLRARKRAVLRALLPALILSAASATGCMAMPAVPSGAHEHGDAHAAHHGDSHEARQAVEPRPTPCPHCPLDSGSGNVGHEGCAFAEVRDGEATYAKDPTWKAPPLIVGSRLPAASAAPPLIATANRAAKVLTATPHLNLRHCVLLI